MPSLRSVLHTSRTIFKKPVILILVGLQWDWTCSQSTSKYGCTVCTLHWTTLPPGINGLYFQDSRPVRILFVQSINELSFVQFGPFSRAHYGCCIWFTPPADLPLAWVSRFTSCPTSKSLCPRNYIPSFLAFARFHFCFLPPRKCAFSLTSLIIRRTDVKPIINSVYAKSDTILLKNIAKWWKMLCHSTNRTFLKRIYFSYIYILLLWQQWRTFYDRN